MFPFSFSLGLFVCLFSSVQGGFSVLNFSFESLILQILSQQADHVNNINNMKYKLQDEHLLQKFSQAFSSIYVITTMSRFINFI